MHPKITAAYAIYNILLNSHNKIKRMPICYADKIACMQLHTVHSIDIMIHIAMYCTF